MGTIIGIVIFLACTALVIFSIVTSKTQEATKEPQPILPPLNTDTPRDGIRIRASENFGPPPGASSEERNEEHPLDPRMLASRPTRPLRHGDMANEHSMLELNPKSEGGKPAGPVVQIDDEEVLFALERLADVLCSRIDILASERSELIRRLLRWKKKHLLEPMLVPFMMNSFEQERQVRGLVELVLLIVLSFADNEYRIFEQANEPLALCIDEAVLEFYRKPGDTQAPSCVVSIVERHNFDEDIASDGHPVNQLRRSTLLGFAIGPEHFSSPPA